jgi:DNA ligase 1
MITRPMLAPNAEEQLSYAKYPIMVSPKIDGLRCITENGDAYTRSFKAIPNPHIRELVRQLPRGLDGELTAGDFRESSSAIRRTWGKPNFTYHIFDYVEEGNLAIPASVRHKFLQQLILPDWCTVLPQIICTCEEEVLDLETKFLAEGYEGAMLRSPGSPYKCNRATLKEGYLLKLKRFHDAEALIVGFYEQEENTNAPKLNQLGFNTRSSHAAGKEGKDTLGGLVVRDLSTGGKFCIGTGVGWTQDWRREIWNNQSMYLNRVITYKYLPHGNYDLPRIATMKGFREDFDL